MHLYFCRSEGGEIIAAESELADPCPLQTSAEGPFVQAFVDVRQEFRYKPRVEPKEKKFQRSYLRTAGQISIIRAVMKAVLRHNYSKFCSWRTTIRLLYARGACLAFRVMRHIR